MKYVFEDHRNDPISQLFRACYPIEVSAEFVYAEGNGNLLKVVKNLTANEKGSIYVYIDLPPDNFYAQRLSEQLCRLRRTFVNVLPIPLICAEYYAVKWLAQLFPEYITNAAWIAPCSKILPWWDAEVTCTMSKADSDFCHNFEKFCKLTLRKSFIDCVSCKKRLFHNGMQMCCFAYGV